jgi:hypothetical protein
MARYIARRARRITWRDRPLFNTRVPFQDGVSQLNRFHTVNKEAKNQLDIDKESGKRGSKRKATSNLKKIENASKAGIIGYQARHLFKEGVGGKPIGELIKEDLAAVGNFAKRAMGRIGEAIGDGEMYAERALQAVEEPLLEAATEMAEFGIMLMV